MAQYNLNSKKRNCEVNDNYSITHKSSGEYVLVLKNKAFIEKIGKKTVQFVLDAGENCQSVAEKIIAEIKEL